VGGIFFGLLWLENIDGGKVLVGVCGLGGGGMHDRAFLDSLHTLRE